MKNGFRLLLISELSYLVFISSIYVVDYLKLGTEVSSTAEISIFLFGAATFLIMQFCLVFSLMRLLGNKDLCDLKHLSSIGTGILLTAVTWLHLMGVFSAALKPQG